MSPPMLGPPADIGLSGRPGIMPVYAPEASRLEPMVETCAVPSGMGLPNSSYSNMLLIY